MFPLSPSTEGEGGHIAFGADPVGIGVRVAHCLHSIYWANGFSSLPNMHRHIIGREEKSD